MEQTSEVAGTPVPAAHLIEELLLVFQVHLGREAWRRKLATGLAEQGMMPMDLEILGGYCSGTTSNDHRASALLRWFLKEPERWKPLVHDIKKSREARRKRMGGENLPQLRKDWQPCVTPEEYARCRIRHEQASREMTAEELGVTPEELDDILGEGSE